MTRAAFFDAVRPIFGGKLSQSQVQGLEILLTATEGLPLTHRAYCLATAKWETAHTMQPVREALAKTDEGAIRTLDRAFAAGKLRHVKTPYWRKDADGKAWFGRGFVQLTHKVNYIRAGQAMGMDLAADPSAALSPMVAARILVQGCTEGWFTGKKLADYLPGDYRAARRIVNGTDRAAEIAQIAEGFEKALIAGGFDIAHISGTGAVSDIAPVDMSETQLQVPPQTEQDRPSGLAAALTAAAVALTAAMATWWDGIIDFIRSIFGG